jgi:hypothetical protein
MAVQQEARTQTGSGRARVRPLVMIELALSQ